MENQELPEIKLERVVVPATPEFNSDYGYITDLVIKGTGKKDTSYYSITRPYEPILDTTLVKEGTEKVVSYQNIFAMLTGLIPKEQMTELERKTSPETIELGKQFMAIGIMFNNSALADLKRPEPTPEPEPIIE